ncbi:MAG: hypothetical protein ACOZNI_04320 [Myxococcota bacterium]
MFVFGGCGGDPCRDLCADVAGRIEECRGEWGASWEDFGADSRRAFRTDCQNEWDETRAELEAREVPAADEQCEDAVTTLAAMSCDEVRALYL